MAKYTVKKINDMEAVFGGGFKRARAEMGGYTGKDSYFFISTNRSKKSVQIDLRQASGRDDGATHLERELFGNTVADGPDEREETAGRVLFVYRIALAFPTREVPHGERTAQDRIVEHRGSLEAVATALVRDFDPRVPVSPLDVSRWQQVFINLAGNAREAMVGANSPTKRITFSTRLKGDEISLFWLMHILEAQLLAETVENLKRAKGE